MRKFGMKIGKLVLGLLLAGFYSAHAEEIALTRGGQVTAVIVHNGHTQPAPNLAANHVRQKHIQAPADELRDYLRQITGLELPLVATLAEAGDKPAIVLELVEKVPGASERDTGKQAYRIKTEGRHLLLTASTPLGLHNAVYGLLEDHLGCRFYTFARKGLGYDGKGYEVVPQKADLTLAGIDDLQEPALANRGIIFWMGSYPWILQNRGIGLTADTTSGALAAGHNMYDLIPPKDKTQRKETIPGLFATHPEFYPVNNAGVREPTWTMGICGTNPDLPKFIAQGLERDIKRRLEQTKGEIDWAMPFSAAQGDGFSGCQCEACRKLAHQEMSESAPLILALNATLEIINQTYPEARVITFAYFATLDAPKTLKPHRNLMINVVSSDAGANAAGDQMGRIKDNPANRDYARALSEWPKIAPDRVTVWHWDTYRAEWPSMFYVAPNMRTFRDSGLYGVNPQFCGGPWVDMLAWLYLKLAWNPDLDGDALIKQFCDDNYGPEAGKHVYNYLQLAQSGYEDNLYLPSAVRWSGWTPTMRVKMWPSALLARMTEAMDQAFVAAEKAGDKVRLANLISARGQGLDVVALNAAAYSGKPWGPALYEKKNWFVTGANPLIPPALLRAKQGIVMDGGGESGVLRTLALYSAGNGGPLVELTGKAMTAAVCPDLKGQITSAVDRKSGRDLLAVNGADTGYTDLFGRISAQIWIPCAENRDVAKRGNDDWSGLWSDFTNPTADALETDVILSPSHYGFYPTQYLRRTVRVTERGLQVERRFIQEKTANGLANPYRFTTRWRLALPDSRQAKVAVKGGGIDQLLDLQYAVAGGITTVKAGEKMKGADYFDERFDTVIAVSGAETTKLPVKADTAGEVIIQLDRGDGTAAILTTLAKGWEAIEIKPIIDQHLLEVTLVGEALPMGTEPAQLDLPVQTLTAKIMPAAPAIQSAVTPQTSIVEAKVKKTGETTAINEIDGALLVFIPAGEFLRGSEKYADEKPSKKIHLDGYWIYKHPVTVEQYKKFCAATGKEFKPTWGQDMRTAPAGKEEDYAVQLNWYQSAEYAKWAGAALPSEAQWEKAARGTDGREYPWGNEWDAAKCASYEGTVGRFSPGFIPVGRLPAGASPYGAEEMAGNVWEWVADWYDHDAYQTAPDRNPAGPETGSHKVLRGGCSLYDERFSRTAARMVQPPQVQDWTPIGFRCVIAPKGE